MRPLRSASLGAIASSLVLASPALAGWTAPQTFSAPGIITGSVAVNARGDAAAAWFDPHAVRVTLRTAAGRMRTLTLWSSARQRLRVAPTAAIDDRGGVTVAWIAAGKTRAAHGTLTGRWATAQILGAGTDEPRLAVAPDRQVLLTWIGPMIRPRSLFYTQVAWRRPGHGFGAAQTLKRPLPLAGARGPRHGAVPAFDAGGTAYLSAACDGSLRVASPGSHHFGSPVGVAGGPAMGLSLSLWGGDEGTGVVSWAASRCSGDDAAGPTGGAVVARTLLGGRFGTPVAVNAGAKTGLSTIAVATAGGGGTVSWYGVGTITGAQIAAPGLLQYTQNVSDGIVPVAADAAGDRVLTEAFPLSGMIMASPLFVQPAGATDRQPAPRGALFYGVSASGRAVVAAGADFSGPRWTLSVWTP